MWDGATAMLNKDEGNSPEIRADFRAGERGRPCGGGAWCGFPGPVPGAIARALAGPLPLPRQAVLRRLKHGAREIDHALLLWFPAPGSFTGEDVAEFHIHGGRAVREALFSALSASGARPAEPGEFSRRAVENGKLDLTRAEAIADLVDAETPAQLRQRTAPA